MIRLIKGRLLTGTYNRERGRFREGSMADGASRQRRGCLEGSGKEKITGDVTV